MIKNFEEYINEDYFSKLASRKDNGNVRKENEITEDTVLDYCEPSLLDALKKPTITIRKDNEKTIVDVDGHFFLKEDVEEIPFQFGTVTGSFSCEYCTSLKSLKGCPEIVGKNFICDECRSLTSLEGCPKEVGWNFECRGCGREFTKDYVQSLCNVKRIILV